MNQSRNEHCPCGSGLRFKKCCGKIPDEPNAVHLTVRGELGRTTRFAIGALRQAQGERNFYKVNSIADEPVLPPRPIPYGDILPFENCAEKNSADPFARTIVDLLLKGNLPQAEILLRVYLEQNPNNPEALNFIGWISAAVNLPAFADYYFSEAVKWAPNWPLPHINRERVRKYLAEGQCQPAIDSLGSKQSNQTEKFLLIKAWGYGFWSDVTHVLGQLLLAELTGRTPIVHWGRNSLFGDDTSANAFEFYFEAFSDWSVVDLQREDFDFWPPKWNHQNLTKDDINKWSGPFSRVAGLYFLGRTEKVVVSDFFTHVLDIKPWIPKEHPLFDLAVDDLCRYLVRTYLHPRNEIMDAVDRFYKEHLASSEFIAVHVRGSDKLVEMSDIDEVNRQYKSILDHHLSLFNCQRIFLMTDDLRLLSYFREMYGNKIITTDCQRTSTEKGIHYHLVADKTRLAKEVMIDTYLAVKAKAFVGNGFSNPSLIARYSKDWPAEAVNLIGLNMFHRHNTFLHNW